MLNFDTKGTLSSAFLLLVLLSFSGCKLRDINFRGVRGYEVTSFSTDRVSIDLAFAVDNPSAFNIKLKPTNLDLYLNDKIVGELKIDKKVKVLKRRDDVYQMPIRAQLTKPLPLSTLMSGKLDARVKGKVKAKILIIGKKFEIDESMPIKL